MIPIPPMPAGPFGAIMADPNWAFMARSPKGQGKSAARHFDTIPLDDLMRLPVAARAAPDCALFLWATRPMIHHAIVLVDAWGFTFKGWVFVWAKPNRRVVDTDGAAEIDIAADRLWFMSTGYSSRGNTEICLLGTRGSPRVRDHAVRELIVSPRRPERSLKPVEAYERAERLFAGPYLTMFPHPLNRRGGWSDWGAKDIRSADRA